MKTYSSCLFQRFFAFYLFTKSIIQKENKCLSYNINAAGNDEVNDDANFVDDGGDDDDADDDNDVGVDGCRCGTDKYH